MYESEAKMVESHNCKCTSAPPRESVEMKLNCIGERVCTAIFAVKGCMTTLFGVNPNEENLPPNDTHGLYGLVDALERDSLRLLAAAEELRKRCGG